MEKDEKSGEDNEDLVEIDRGQDLAKLEGIQDDGRKDSVELDGIQDGAEKDSVELAEGGEE